MVDAIQTLALGTVGLVALVTLFIRWDQERQRRRLRTHLTRATLDATEARTASERHTLEQQERLLLLRVLTPAQAESFRITGQFELVAPSGRRYRLMAGQASNVAELNAEGRPIRRFCIGTARYTTYAGQLAAQALVLRTDEAAFHKIANSSSP